MRARRIACATVVGATLGWGLLAACGSERPPPAESNPPPSPDGSSTLGPGSDAGGGGGGEGGGGIADSGSGDRVDCPDPPFGISIFEDGGRRECICTHRHANGLLTEIQCGWGLCTSSGAWFCNLQRELHFIPSPPVCDASAVPDGHTPCIERP